MRRVKDKDTAPEMLIRRMVYGMGYRYRLHRKELPGKPDLVFPGRRKIIFVHGCFWHGHPCKRGARMPKTNTGYWRRKIERNRTRDREHLDALENSGWRVLVIWECELKDRDALTLKIQTFLEA
jgi:DNA mismatch endonuclease (patch repair protein)